MKLKGIDPLKLLETLQEGVVVHSATTQVLYANPRALEIMRLSENQVLGKNAFEPEWRFIDKHHKLMPHQDFPVNRALAEKKPFQILKLAFVIVQPMQSRGYCAMHFLSLMRRAILQV
jgi:PAS domain-containing protein